MKNIYRIQISSLGLVLGLFFAVGCSPAAKDASSSISIDPASQSPANSGTPAENRLACLDVVALFARHARLPDDTKINQEIRTSWSSMDMGGPRSKEMAEYLIGHENKAPIISSEAKKSFPRDWEDSVVEQNDCEFLTFTQDSTPDLDAHRHFAQVLNSAPDSITFQIIESDLPRQIGKTYKLEPLVAGYRLTEYKQIEIKKTRKRFEVPEYATIKEQIIKEVTYSPAENP